jgi:fructose 5-dehydrogenase small subunit
MAQRPNHLLDPQPSPNENPPSNCQPTLPSVSNNPGILKRRELLLLAGAGFAVLSMPRWLQPASAQTTTAVVTPKTATANSQQQSDFFALSALLTANSKLNPHTSARTYAALCAQVIEFEKQSADLWRFSQVHQIKGVEALSAAVAGNAALSRVLHQIVSVWYLGVVGSGVQGKVIAFEQALMFDPVRDAVVVPTYCRAAPGYWATQPAVLKGSA